MADILSRCSGIELVILVAVAGGLLIGLVSAVIFIVGAFWESIRVKEMAGTLVQDMLEQRVPPAEIAEIVRAAALGECGKPRPTESGQPPASTGWMGYWNRKVRKLTIVDLKLVQIGSMAGILVIASLFPQIMSLSIWWFVAVFAVCMVRPAYVFWLTDE